MKGRDKRKRYKQYRARKEQFPASYREAIDAVERYALRFGPAAGETVLTMLEDLAGSFEQGAKAGVPVSEIVGDDPLGFTDGFLTGYPANQWAGNEQRRLARTIADAERAEGQTR